jgi:hypothetical protein
VAAEHTTSSEPEPGSAAEEPPRFVDLTATPSEASAPVPEVVAPPPPVIDMTDTPADPDAWASIPAPVPDPERWQQDHVTATAVPGGEVDPEKEWYDPELLHGEVPGTSTLFPRSAGGWLGLVLKVVVVAAACWIPFAVHGVCFVSLLFSLGILAVALVVLRPRWAVWRWVVVAAVAFGLLELWNGTGFDTLSLLSPPPAMQWCGTHYLRAATLAHRPPHLATVGTAPSGTPILSARSCQPDGPGVRVIYGGGLNGTTIVYRFDSVSLGR